LLWISWQGRIAASLFWIGPAFMASSETRTRVGSRGAVSPAASRGSSLMGVQGNAAPSPKTKNTILQY